MQHETDDFPPSRVIEGRVSAVHSLPARAAEPLHDDGLSDRQRAFVDAYCGGDEPGNAQAAAIAAGYAESGAANMASRNLLNPKIQAEVERRVRIGRGSAMLAGVSALFDLVENATDERARVAAAVALLDRFGMAPPKGPAVAVQINNQVNAGEASAVLTMIAERARARNG